MRAFCFPYAGGGASIFRKWPGLLPETIELIAIQPPGRETRFVEPLSTDLHASAVAVADAMRPWLDLPFVIFGHSLGTLLGYQTAVELRRRGLGQPALLCMSGRGAPHLEKQRCERHLLPHDRFVEELRDMQGTPDEVLASEELMELLVPILRADFALNASYDPGNQPPFDCPLVAYGGTTDVDVAHADLHSWQRYTNRSVDVRMFEGGHFFVDTSREQVLSTFREDLERCMP